MGARFGFGWLRPPNGPNSSLGGRAIQLAIDGDKVHGPALHESMGELFVSHKHDDKPVMKPPPPTDPIIARPAQNKRPSQRRAA